jgi:holo-[acyl-carrier protein] synthase
MLLAVGVDLVDAGDVEEAIRVHGHRYLDRVYSREELLDCHGDPVLLAARFAVKEATIKALDCSDEPLPWRDIALQRDTNGRLSVALSGSAAELARRRDVRMLSVSISHTSKLAGAVVLAEMGS